MKASVIVIHIVIFVLLTGSACKKQYKLNFNEDVPESVSKLLNETSFSEGRNLLMEDGGRKLFIDIEKGKVTRAWFQTEKGQLVNLDSVSVTNNSNDSLTIIAMNIDLQGGQAPKVDCSAKYDICLRICPWIPWKDKTGKVLDLEMKPSCNVGCNLNYSFCKLINGGFRNSISVIQ